MVLTHSPHMVEVPEVTNSLNDIKDGLDFWKMLKEL